MDDDDTPAVAIRGNKITWGKHTYELIMCYRCPICQEPIIAYWIVPPGNNRATPQIVGRALRDSGFGGYRFFETDQGQGVEADPEKDPRQKHSHKEEKAGYMYGAEVTQQWIPFIKLNPIFSVNDWVKRCIDSYTSGDPILYVKTQAHAQKVIDAMVGRAEFKVVEDSMGHGKPVFFFNFVKWEKAARSKYDKKEKFEALKGMIGSIADTLDLGEKEKEE